MGNSGHNIIRVLYKLIFLTLTNFQGLRIPCNQLSVVEVGKFVFQYSRWHICYPYDKSHTTGEGRPQHPIM